MKKKDYVVDVMQQWYDAMGKQNIGVQPKSATILGTILSRYDVKPKERPSKEDLFDTYMNTKAGELEGFWQSLSNSEKAYIETRRQQMRDQYYADRGLTDDQGKTLLKG